MFLNRSIWLSNTVEHQFGKMSANLFAENSNRGEWRIELDCVQIIATHYTYFFRNANVEISERFVDTVSARVRSGKDCRRRFSACEYRLRAEIADTFLLLTIESGLACT